MLQMAILFICRATYRHTFLDTSAIQSYNVCEELAPSFCMRRCVHDTARYTWTLLRSPKQSLSFLSFIV
jgi:hypothetical protein